MKQKKKFTPKELTTIALLSALLCVSSYISIRLPFSAIPITAQTLVINLIALLLKPKRAWIPVLVWILLGAIGLPVFSNGTSGIGIVAGPTGGYMFGYLTATVLIALVRGKKNSIIRNTIAVIAVGIPVIYAIGVPWMKVMTGLDWKAAIVSGVLPFIAGDILKCVAALAIAKPLYRFVADDDVPGQREMKQFEKTEL